jgi:hypothetical protein
MINDPKRFNLTMFLARTFLYKERDYGVVLS